MIAANYTVREMEGILRKNGFQFIRQNGSHQIWADKSRRVTLPGVTLKPVIAQKIIKENGLRT